MTNASNNNPGKAHRVRRSGSHDAKTYAIQTARKMEHDAILDSVFNSDDQWRYFSNLNIIDSNWNIKSMRHPADTIPFDANPVDFWKAKIAFLENALRFCRMNLKQVSK